MIGKPFRIAIMAKTEQQFNYAKSQMRFLPKSVELTCVSKPSDLFKYDKFHLIFECDYFHQHAIADELLADAIKKLV